MTKLFLPVQYTCVQFKRRRASLCSSQIIAANDSRADLSLCHVHVLALAERESSTSCTFLSRSTDFNVTTCGPLKRTSAGCPAARIHDEDSRATCARNRKHHSHTHTSPPPHTDSYEVPRLVGNGRSILHLMLPSSPASRTPNDVRCWGSGTVSF